MHHNKYILFKKAYWKDPDLLSDTQMVTMN
jgi:hypothetical protein